MVRVEGTGNDSIKSRACLLVGALPSNKLLACRPLCLETFPSPLTLRLKANLPKGTVAPLTVSEVASGLLQQVRRRLSAYTLRYVVLKAFA